MKENQNQNRNQNQNENNQSKQVLLSVLAVAILVVAVVGVSFAAFTYSEKGLKTNRVTTGTVKMEYNEETNGISLTNALPVSDEVGKTIGATAPDPVNEGSDASAGTGVGQFDFTVSAEITGTTSIGYEVTAIKTPIEENALEDNEVKLYLEKEETGVYKQAMAPQVFTPREDASTIGSPEGSMVLYNGTFDSTKTEKFRLRMWVADTYQVVPGGPSEKYEVKINVYGKAS